MLHIIQSAGLLPIIKNYLAQMLTGPRNPSWDMVINVED